MSAEQTERSARWHMVHPEGRVFIVYLEDETDVQAIAKRWGCSSYHSSGYYEQQTNTIVGALDGETTVYENWTNGVPR